MNGLGKCRPKEECLASPTTGMQAQKRRCQDGGQRALSTEGLKAWQRKLDVLPALGKQHKGADCR